MQAKSIAQQLLERLIYWEFELDYEPSPHPEPAERLDRMIEEFIDETAALMSKLADAKERNAELDALLITLKRIAKSQDQLLQRKEARIKDLEGRLYSIRKGLGIENKGEADWL